MSSTLQLPEIRQKPLETCIGFDIPLFDEGDI